MFFNRVFVVACLALLIGCSSNSSRVENPISPYDGEFDDSRKKIAENENSKSEGDALAEALQYYDSGLYSSARDNLKKIQDEFPMSYYLPLIEIKLADSNYNLGDYITALALYEEFEKQRPNHEAIPYVVLQIANSHFAQYRGAMNDQFPAREAAKHYKRFIEKFPSSVYKNTAVRLLDKCQTSIAKHERLVAAFYKEQGLADAWKNREHFAQIENKNSLDSKNIPTSHSISPTLLSSIEIEQEFKNKFGTKSVEKSNDTKVSSSAKINLVCNTGENKNYTLISIEVTEPFFNFTLEDTKVSEQKLLLRLKSNDPSKSVSISEQTICAQNKIYLENKEDHKILTFRIETDRKTVWKVFTLSNPKRLAIAVF